MKNQHEEVEVINKGTNPNLDPLSGAPGAHPIGTGLGAAGGAAAGAVAGAVAGPIGAAVGLLAGGIVGGLGGKGVAEAIDPTYEDEYWVLNYPTRPYAKPNIPYESYRPAYRVGYEGYERYPAKSFDEVESDLRRDYEKIRGNANLEWKEAQHAARDAWYRVAKK